MLIGLSEGSYYIVVYANDTAGNVGFSNPIYFNMTKEPEPTPQPEPFATTLVAASVVSVAVVCRFIVLL